MVDHQEHTRAVLVLEDKIITLDLTPAHVRLVKHGMGHHVSLTVHLDQQEHIRVVRVRHLPPTLDLGQIVAPAHLHRHKVSGLAHLVNVHRGQPGMDQHVRLRQHVHPDQQEHIRAVCVHHPVMFTTTPPTPVNVRLDQLGMGLVVC